MRKKAMQSVIFFVLFLVALILFGCWGDLFGSKSATQTSEVDYDKMREKMITEQIKRRGVNDPKVLEALETVERHHFVQSGYEKQAYEDNPLPIGHGQTISQPYIVALMTELLDPDANDVILEIGTGSGYQAAVLSKIVKQVYTIEIVPELGKQAAKILKEHDYENVEVKIGDGYKGWPEHAPFDGVIVTAAPDHVPQPLIDQLKIGGKLVIPVGSHWQDLYLYTKSEEGLEKKNVIPVRFVPMTGEAQKK